MLQRRAFGFDGMETAAQVGSESESRGKPSYFNGLLANGEQSTARPFIEDVLHFSWLALPSFELRQRPYLLHSNSSTPVEFQHLAVAFHLTHSNGPSRLFNRLIVDASRWQITTCD